MTSIKFTGGARIGNMNATWPMAKLIVTEQTMELRAALLGNYVFRPADLISIEPYVLVPLIGQGIKINHRVPGYNDRIIFWSFKSPSAIVEQIKKVGFSDSIGA